MTITAVRMSPCLRQARIYVLPFGGSGFSSLLRKLQDRTPFLRREVAQRLALRHVPELHFLIDENFAYGARIEDLLRALPPVT
jgi:ribosome-binding factor A